VSSHRPIRPADAIELVEAAGLQDGCNLLADFAAAGLIKSYALARETTSHGSERNTLRDAQIPSDLWQRVIAAEKVEDAVNRGSVHLAGSHEFGGLPAVQITGISFSEGSLQKVIDRYCKGPSNSVNVAAPIEPSDSADGNTLQSESSGRNTKVAAAADPIKPGAEFATIPQVMEVANIGRTKVYNLIEDQILVRRKMGRKALITMASLRKYVSGEFGTE